MQEDKHAASDFSQFLLLSKTLRLEALGRGPDVFLSYGAYALNGKMTFARGVSEDHASSWLVRADGPRPPSRGLTLPDADAAGGYSWCKAPRLGGLVAETGAQARQLVDRHPLVVNIAAKAGSNVRNRLSRE